MAKKVLFFMFKHETNALSPAPADMDAYIHGGMCVGQEILTANHGAGSDITAVLETFANDPAFELIPVVTMFASPSGPVTKEVYDFVADRLTAAITENSRIDGVIILFHGAMVAQGHPDAEGDLLELLRSMVGADIPIMASLDLHANVTRKMARLATALIPYEEYPHVDTYATGKATAQLLRDTLSGKCKPVMACCHIPHLLPLFPTGRKEIRPLYDLSHSLQNRTGGLCVRFTHGYFASDIEELGMTTLAITDNDLPLAQAMAQELADAIDAIKDTLKEDYLTLDEALDLALEDSDKPIVIADTSDNPGGGGLGNSTHILRRVLERKMEGCAFAMIADPKCAEICHKAGVGAQVTLQLGGWSDPVFSGGPIEVCATVRSLSDGWYTRSGPMNHGTRVCMGDTAVVEISGNLVIITTHQFQPYDTEIFRSNGIVPETQKLLVVKSSIHYQASFGAVARQMLPVPMPGYNVPYPQGFPFRNWKGKV